MTSQTRQPPAFFSAQIAQARRFHRDVDPSDTLPLTVVCGGCEHCAPDYAIRRRSFPYSSIEFVAQGKGRLVLGGRACDLVAGTVFTYGPGVSQDIATDPDETMVKYFIDFTGRGSRALLARLSLGPGEVLQTSAPNAIMAILDELIQAGLADTPFSSRVMSVLLEYLVLKLAETRIPYGSAGSVAFETYRRCRNVIEDQWRRFNTLEEVAGGCHIDPAYLCRLFRRFDHVSPYQYLQRMRMNHAARLLQEPGASVKVVADVLGYGDAFHFSRVFKKAMGISPSRYIGSARQA